MSEETPQNKRPEKKMDFAKIMKLRKRKYTYKMIAAELGTTEQVIKNTVYRARHAGSTAVKKTPERIKRDEMAALEEIKSNLMSNRTFNNTAMAKGSEGRARTINQFLAECAKIRAQADIDHVETLYAGFEAYVNLCIAADMPMTLATVCFALGVTSNTLNSWRTGKSRTEDYKIFAEGVHSAIKAGIEAGMASGAVNPIVGIWWEKAHYQMIEAQRAENVSGDPLGQRRTAEQIAADYDETPLPD